jgi:Ni,Fe-hydrogenase III small subunit
MAQSSQPRPTAVWLLQLDSGGCGACVQQIYSLFAPRYAATLRAQGLSMARSPRHADVILVTGALTVAAREPLQHVLDGVPEPRALIAVGNCAIDGCVFRGSPYLAQSAAEALDVNVEIAGCPPTPQAILDAITEAAVLLRSEQGDDDADAGREVSQAGSANGRENLDV